jgi:hypothetical protein
VSDPDIPTSGSRWEPTSWGLTTPADVARPSRRPRRLPGRGAAAAAGIGLVLAGGAGARPDFRDGDRPGPGGVRADGTAPEGTGPGDTPPDSGGGGTA